MTIAKITFAFIFMAVSIPGTLVALFGQTSNPPPSPQFPQLHTIWDGVYAEKQAQRGLALYQHQCSSCHGDKLTGKATDSVPALTGRDLEVDWNGRTVADLFKEILRKMPQDDPGALTPQQSADLVAFILNFNKFPPGEAELPPESDQLAVIRILIKKPDQHSGPGQPK